jgi:hypothetical protein
MSFGSIVYITCLTSVLTLIANWVGYKNGIVESIPGMLILMGICLLGVIIARFMPGQLPSVAYIVVIGCIVTYPDFPGAKMLNAYIAKVNFLALTTPILAYAGIGIGKDIDAFLKSGWRIVIVACAVFVGTFVGSAIIAEIVLRMTGQI